MSRVINDEARKRLFAQLTRLGDMLGEGDLTRKEEAQISREYRQVCAALGITLPARKRAARDPAELDRIDERMKARCWDENCPSCHARSLEQTRRGSMTAQCRLCGRRFKLLRKGKA